MGMNAAISPLVLALPPKKERSKGPKGTLLAGWLAGWLAGLGWLAGWLAGWLVGKLLIFSQGLRPDPDTPFGAEHKTRLQCLVARKHEQMRPLGGGARTIADEP